jgi:2,3-dihydroxybiphenyl 1,2-dioxygenase
MPVKQLGYLIFECEADVLEQMVTVYRDVIGAAVEQDESGRALVRLDGRPFRIRLDPGPANRLAAIGWEVVSADLTPIAAKVEAAGYGVAVSDAKLASDRAAAEVRRFTDADGFVHELFVEAPFAADASLDALFVCGDEPNGTFGLGHLVQISGDRAKAQAFYTEVLGFGLSDRITWPAADLYFLHCNQRHHTVALSAPALGLEAGMIHHLMIEAKSKDQVDRAYETLKEKGLPVIMTIGQHTNDEVYSFYMIAPAGFAIEFGFGGKVVEDPANWPVGFYDAPSIWGHELQLPPQ